MKRILLLLPLLAAVPAKGQVFLCVPPASGPGACQPVTSSNPLPSTATLSGSVTANSAATAIASPPSTLSPGSQVQYQSLRGELYVQPSLAGTPISSTAGMPVQGVTVTLVPLDVSTVTTGGTAVTALSAGHRTKGGWIQNPSTATQLLCLSETGTAATTQGGSTTCLPAGITYQLVPSGGAVSVNAPDGGHPFSGYGFN